MDWILLSNGNYSIYINVYTNLTDANRLGYISSSCMHHVLYCHQAMIHVFAYLLHVIAVLMLMHHYVNYLVHVTDLFKQNESQQP